jgi:hypothetical protein
VKRYRSQPVDILGWIMGSSQRLPGGNTLVGWGSGIPNVTEFKPDGTKALEFDYESVSYRAYKFPWENSILDVDYDSLGFGEIYYENTKTRTIQLTNNLGKDVIITWMHSHSGKYSIMNELPMTISAGSSEELSISFDPQEIGDFPDMLTIYGEESGQTIVSAFATQVEVGGSASEEASVDESEIIDIRLFPNPASDIVHIKRTTKYGTLVMQLFSSHGSLIIENTMADGENSLDLNIESLTRGIYFLNVTDAGSGLRTSYKIIAK